MPVYTLQHKTPQFGNDCFIAPQAVIIGDVISGSQCSFWFHAVVRGDVNTIRIGNRVNIQDHAMLHCTYQKAALHIGDDVSIGHRAIIHGCTIESKVLIGMGAIVMDHCHIEPYVIIAAGAVLTENTRAESGWIYAGTPAKKIKKVSEALKQGEIERIANNYILYSSWYSNFNNL